jgi:uncharacterized cupin superfamily protein
MGVIKLPSAENTEGRIDVAKLMGSSELLMFVYDIEPGGASCPYHYEFNEEWLLVVDGSIAVRVPEGELALERGDLVFFAAGPEGAHRIMNRGDAPARALLFSRKGPGIAVYPDSDKVGVWTGIEDEDRMLERSKHVGYFHGEA